VYRPRLRKSVVPALGFVAAASVFATGVGRLQMDSLSTSSEPGRAPSKLMEKAWNLCHRLEAARAARNCIYAGRTLERESFTLRFDPIDDAPAEGMVTVFLSTRATRSSFPADQAVLHGEDVPIDDYPMLEMTSRPSVAAGAWRITWTTARWQSCRALRTVAACATLYSDEYTNAQRLYEVARQMADGPPSPEGT
jgi:hypothetical protein